MTRMALGFVCLLTLMAQSSQDYPTKRVRVIEPFGAGGGPDLMARAVSPRLSELWGQPVTVENHPGAGSTAAPALVAKSPADGYTLLVNTSAQAYSAALLKNLPYDPLKDFIPVAPLTSQPYVLVAGKLAGITTVGELVAAAKAKPAELKFGSTGLGTGTHLGVEKFNLAAGIKAIHVPARQGDAIADTNRQYCRRAHRLPAGTHSARPRRYPGGQASRARCEHQEALVLATGGADDCGGRRRRLRLPDLVWGMGARRHSGRSGGQTSEGYRPRSGRAGCARRPREARGRSDEHDAA
jgi:Tripartite tricarboxylate transporter family receptor